TRAYREASLGSEIGDAPEGCVAAWPWAASGLIEYITRRMMSFMPVSKNCSGQAHPRAPAAFKNGENIRNAEQFADPRAQIQELQFALRALRRNVKCHQSPQARTIHVPEFAQVQNQRPSARKQRLHFRLQMRRGFSGQPPGATHHGSVFPSISVQ